MASVLIGNSCQTQTLQGLGRMGVVTWTGYKQSKLDINIVKVHHLSFGVSYFKIQSS